ncbi:MAG TPA: tetratricopeptide repeat protein [Pyrinomonadaceae bacterium]
MLYNPTHTKERAPSQATLDAPRFSTQSKRMTGRLIKGFIFPLAMALCLLLPLAVRAREKREEWTSVQSKNFLLVGNASQRDIRKVAARLEQFREAFLRLLSVEHFDSSVPLTVIVFKDDEAYRPFEPLYRGQPSGVAGFFQSSPDVDYITLSVDRKHVRSADALAFHEYVHLLVRNSFGDAPLWFNEGLAEYYSTFEISDGNKKVTLGKPMSYRTQMLRERNLLPLEMLFKVDDQSPYYTESDKRALFYAESWALMHYLLSGHRRTQLSVYLQLLAKGMEIEDAFRQAFQSDFATVEQELRAYLHLNKFPQQVITFDKRLEFETVTRSAPLSEAETQFYLGDLLLHTNRPEEAARYLRKAIALDPTLARAHASLGVAAVRGNRFDDAKKHLEIASRASQNYLIHYYYAYVLSREAIGSDNVAEGFYENERAQLMRAELEKVIELSPRFAEAYRLLAFINLTRNEKLDESIELLKKAINLSPRRQDFLLLLAQVHLRREEFDVARKTLEPLMLGSMSAQVRTQAQSLLAAVASREEYVTRVKALNDKLAADALRDETPPGVLQPCDAPQPGPQLKKLRFTGEQVCGMLVRIECEENGVVLVIEAGARTYRLRNDSLNSIRFVTYTVEVRGQVTCGLRAQSTPVLVTYRPNSNPVGQTDGEVIAVEFVPKEWDANH